MPEEKESRRVPPPVRSLWWSWLLSGAAVFAGAHTAPAATFLFTGLITQSISDGTGPAFNNAALSGLVDGDSYGLQIVFTGGIVSPGTYDLSAGTMLFTDFTHGVTENGFNTISLTVAPDGSNYDVSLLACLATGSGCFVGNQLTANFSIPMAGLVSQNVAADALALLNPPMDLLEDDGTTDIQGSVTRYSQTGVPAPEPSTLWLCCAALPLLRWKRRRLGTRNR